MKIMPSNANFVAEQDLWECMNANAKFNDFIGQCLTHFEHFVIPRRDQTKEIQQDYPVPVDIEDVGGNVVMLTRKDGGNVIYIEFWRW